MIRIIIIEDNPQFRKALESIVEREEDMELLFSFPDAEKAYLSLVTTAPDVAIVDINLPGMSGIELISRVKQRTPSVQFLVCTIHDDTETLFKALQKGATGYLLKEPVSVTKIKEAIREIYNGGSPMSPYIARKVIDVYQKPSIEEEEAHLSKREKETLELLARGLTYREIGNNLSISPETVRKHVKNIYNKLHVQNKIEAVNKFRKF